MDQGHRGAVRRPMEKSWYQPLHSPPTPVDYDDVFGGPPRLVASLLSSSSSSAAAAAAASSLPPAPLASSSSSSSAAAPTVLAEKTTLSKVPSFRSARVFELPVFGDDVMPASSPHLVYEDIFKENRQAADPFPGPALYGNPNSDSNSRSRPSSRAGSRRMSPVHPSSPAAKNEPTHEETLRAKSSLPSFLKSRSGGGGKVTSKSPFSSFSSVEESRAKGLDSPSLLPTRSALTSPTVPPSPSQHLPSQLKRLSKSSSNNNVPLTSIDVDDVFGGFPQRSLLQQRLNNGRDAHKIQPEKDYPNNAMRQGNTAFKTSDEFARKHQAFSRSFSSTKEQGLHDDFIEINMDTERPRGLQNVGKEWITVNDLRQSAKTLQPDNVSQLQFKPWKDQPSDLHTNLSTSSITELFPGKMEGFLGSVEKNRDLEVNYSKNIVENLLRKQSSGLRPVVEQYEDKKILASLSPTFAEEAVEIEERELQALLASAWKLNEEREKKQKEQSRVLRERPKVVESKEQEILLREQKDSRQLKESRSQKSRGDRKNSKLASTHSRQEKSEDKPSNSATVEPNSVSSKVPVPDTAHVFGKNDSIVEDNFTIVSEEILTELSSRVAADAALDRRGERQSMNIAGKPTNFQTSIKSDGVVNADKCAEVDPLQDIVQLNEEFDISPREEIEDIECFLGLVSSLDGFQEIEGESLERRKSRLERHVRTKERAAKALEEMQQREAESQREQEEKQQLAEISDRKIKRWAAGKEGNLRALLSNLQYVLWPDSGWTTLPLTSLIEGSDVKKAYRKATLFIHPDKLQQKSATLEQKYIAERVFDILQEAWKTFNMQELF